MSGSSCATTGSRTGSSPPMRPSSITAVPPGTSSPTNPGASCPSVSATGPTGSDQRDLVLHLYYATGTGQVGHQGDLVPNPFHIVDAASLKKYHREMHPRRVQVRSSLPI